MSELVTATGLSRATVDRALNRRAGVHPRTEQLVRDALTQLGRPADALGGELGAEQPVRADAVVRLGRGLMDQILAIREARDYPLDIFDMYQKGDDEVLEVVSELCRRSDRPLIITAKNTEALRSELEHARRRGKLIVSLVSDLSHDARDAHVGIDNRMAGQTAAHLIGHLLAGRSAKVGAVLGDYAYRCHEDREIGFRSYLRSAFPGLVLADVAKGEDSAEQTLRAVRQLLEAHPDIQAIYNVGGGNLGLAQAVTEAGRVKNLHVIAHEVNAVTVPLVERGQLFCVIAQDASRLLDQAVRLAQDAGTKPHQEHYLLDFGVYTKFNLPRFAAIRQRD